jgi:hypothetical protein
MTFIVFGGVKAALTIGRAFAGKAYIVVAIVKAAVTYGYIKIGALPVAQAKFYAGV